MQQKNVLMLQSLRMQLDDFLSFFYTKGGAYPEGAGLVGAKSNSLPMLARCLERRGRGIKSSIIIIWLIIKLSPGALQGPLRMVMGGRAREIPPVHHQVALNTSSHSVIQLVMKWCSTL